MKTNLREKKTKSYNSSEDTRDISNDEIYHVTKKMNDNKALGEDGVVTEAIKFGRNTLNETIKLQKYDDKFRLVSVGKTFSLVLKSAILILSSRPLFIQNIINV